MPFRRSFTPVLDGGLVNIGDGTVRKQTLKIEAGEYTPPIWLRTEAGLVVPVSELPFQTVLEAGELQILSSSPNIIELTAHRLAAGTDTTTISFGIPLTRGQLMPADIGEVALYKDGAEVQTYIEALLGAYDDGSLVSILVQHDAGSMTKGTAVTGYELRFGVTPALTPAAKNAGAIKKLPDGALLPPPAYFKERIAAVWGPLLPLDEVASALGADWEEVDTILDTALDHRWETLGEDATGEEDTYAELAQQFGGGSYGPVEHFDSWYDQPQLRIQHACRGGDIKNLERGLLMAAGCSQRVNGQGSFIQWHRSNVFCHSMGYWLTGVTAHRDAALTWAHSITIGGQTLSSVPANDDGRITGKTIMALLQAWLLGDTSTYDSDNITLLESLDGRVQFSLDRQYPDGHWNTWGADVEDTGTGQNTPLEAQRAHALAFYIEYRGSGGVALGDVHDALVLHADFMATIFDDTNKSWDYKTGAGPYPGGDLTFAQMRSLSLMCAFAQTWAYGAGAGASHLDDPGAAIAMHAANAPNSVIPIHDAASYGLKNLTETYNFYAQTFAKAAGLGLFT